MSGTMNCANSEVLDQPPQSTNAQTCLGFAAHIMKTDGFMIIGLIFYSHQLYYLIIKECVL